MNLTPSSWGSPFREANDCHEPAGKPTGGQFCSKGGGAWYGGRHPKTLSADEFEKLHYTGFIGSDAYEDYEKPGGLGWLGGREKYPTVVGVLKDAAGKTYEVRATGKKERYVRTDADGEIVRGSDGLALYLTDDEVRDKGRSLYDQTRVLFDGPTPIGLVSNEFGAIGLWIEKAYQRKGLGRQLLALFMRENPGMRAGQMTNAGIGALRAAHALLAKEAAK